MAAITWADVLGFSARLNATPTIERTGILAFVNAEAFDVTNFGGESAEKLKRARIYLAAHLGLIPLLGLSGQLVGESEGGVDRRFSPPLQNRVWLAQTAAGRLLLFLIDTTVARMPVVA